MKTTTIVVAGTIEQARLAAVNLGLSNDEWKHARVPYDLDGARVASIVVAYPTLNSTYMYRQTLTAAYESAVLSQGQVVEVVT